MSITADQFTEGLETLWTTYGMSKSTWLWEVLAPSDEARRRRTVLWHQFRGLEESAFLEAIAAVTQDSPTRTPTPAHILGKARERNRVSPQADADARRLQCETRGHAWGHHATIGAGNPDRAKGGDGWTEEVCGCCLASRRLTMAAAWERYGYAEVWGPMPNGSIHGRDCRPVAHRHTKDAPEECTEKCTPAQCGHHADYRTEEAAQQQLQALRALDEAVAP